MHLMFLSKKMDEAGGFIALAMSKPKLRKHSWAFDDVYQLMVTWDTNLR